MTDKTGAEKFAAILEDALSTETQAIEPRRLEMLSQEELGRCIKFRRLEMLSQGSCVDAKSTGT